jgi:hypothetical protein
MTDPNYKYKFPNYITLWIVVFWAETSCGLIYSYLCFKEIYHPHMQDRHR